MSAGSSEVRPVESPGADRVRAHTDPDVQHEIDRAAIARVAECRDAGHAELTRRIHEIEHTSDIERVLEINAATLALTGVLLGAFKDRRLLVLPVIVLGFLLQHGLQGWCPPVPLFRKLGVRSRQELDAEKYALKALRGDFASLSADGPAG